MSQDAKNAPVIKSSSILTALIKVKADAIQVSCTGLSGLLVEDYIFPLETNLSDLEERISSKRSGGNAILAISTTFLSDDGEQVSKADCLEKYATLCIQTDVIKIEEFLSAFNDCKSPKEVARVLHELDVTPDAAGKLLYRAGEGISVQLLGECLGNHGEYWKQVAVSYPANFTCFGGMDIVQAIRAYLWCFRLPGEAAQIERIVDGFARSYFYFNSASTNEANPEVQDSDPDSDEEASDEAASQHCWDAGAMGWYVRQPLSGPKLLPCCTHCGRLDGRLDGEEGNLCLCQGCNVIHFCRKCQRMASRYGHAVVGTIGYGRACVAAKIAAGDFGPDHRLTFRSSCGMAETATASKRSLKWEPASPFRSADSVMVLAYAIIMLTTNLHSSNVKDKMKKHEFIRQNNTVNDGENFPGDFLAKVYDDIKQEELKVMRKDN